MKTIACINEWSRAAGIRDVHLLNFAVSDGRCIVCSRYVNSTSLEPASLFFSSGG